MKKFLKKYVIELILSIILVAGLCLILYPTVSDWWNSLHQSRAIASLVETVDGLSEEECEERLAKARAYNESLRPETGDLSSQRARWRNITPFWMFPARE